MVSFKKKTCIAQNKTFINRDYQFSPEKEFGVTNKVDNGGAFFRGRECAFFCSNFTIAFLMLAYLSESSTYLRFFKWSEPFIKRKLY